MQAAAVDAVSCCVGSFPDDGDAGSGISPINSPVTPYMLHERGGLGSIDYEWTSASEMAPEVLRPVVAVGDANFCPHWGFGVKAIAWPWPRVERAARR